MSDDNKTRVAKFNKMRDIYAELLLNNKIEANAEYFCINHENSYTDYTFIIDSKKLIKLIDASETDIIDFINDIQVGFFDHLASLTASMSTYHEELGNYTWESALSVAIYVCDLTELTKICNTKNPVEADIWAINRAREYDDFDFDCDFDIA